jgi:hypothetical protein
MDTGPGRNNGSLLVKLKANGFYLLFSVPNARHLTQEIDASLSEFKRGFNNPHLVTSAYLTHNKSIPTGNTMVGLLVFGARIFDLELDLDDVCWMRVNAIWNAGTLERMIDALEKVGLCPFTIECLQDENVHHDIIITVDGDADYAADPEALLYFDVDRINRSACDALV